MFEMEDNSAMRASRIPSNSGASFDSKSLQQSHRAPLPFTAALGLYCVCIMYYVCMFVDCIFQFLSVCMYTIFQCMYAPVSKYISSLLSNVRVGRTSSGQISRWKYALVEWLLHEVRSSA